MWQSTDTEKRGNKERFNKTIAILFNLKSPNTVRWITSGNTNNFFNQDIVQTTKYNTWLSEYNKLWKASEPVKTKADYAKELDVNYSSFVTRWNMFNKDIDATVAYFRQLKCMQ